MTAVYAHGALALGAGPALLLLPGFGCGHRLMLPLAERLAERARVLVTDHRGMGQAPPATAAYTFDHLAADNWAAADAHGLDKLVLAGVSMGGLLAQAMALRCPERVRALVLMCTLSTDPAYRRPEELDDAALRQLFSQPDYPLHSIRAGVAADYPEREPEAFAALVALKQRDRAQAEQAVRQAQAFRAFMACPLELTRLTCPVLVLSGDRDQIVDPTNSQRLARDLSRASLQLFPNTGHLFFLEQTQAVSQSILAFMESL